MKPFFIMLLAMLPQLAWANPFTDGKPAAVAAPLVGTPFLSQILALQRQFHDGISTHLMALRDGASLTPLWLLLGLSFAYGVFHVLAPGHGKIIVSAYFLGNKARWRDGLLAGAVMAVGHTVTSVAVVLVLYLALGVSQLQLLSQARYVELIGYGAIATIGVWLLLRARRGSAPCSHCGHHHDHAGHTHDHAPQPPTAGRGSILGLFSAVSLVPCTGSMIILLFTLAHQVLWAGILAVMAIAFGMWLTTVAIACAAIFLHARLLAPERPRHAWQVKLQRGLGYASALAVLATGGLLFGGTLLSLLHTTPD